MAAASPLNRQNYQSRVRQDEAGNEQTFYECVSPTSEANHLTPMQTQATAQMAGTNLRSEAAIALEEPESPGWWRGERLDLDGDGS